MTIALERSYVAGETDVSAQTLEAVAELLTLRRDTIPVIDIAEAEEAYPASYEQAKDKGAPRGPSGRTRSTPSRREMRSDQGPEVSD